MAAPRVLYLHGFASGPRSKKGLAVEERLAARGLAVERLDLRVPSLERLSLAAGIARTRAAIGGPDDRAVLIGSSLGGLTAARLAEDDARVTKLVLLAPAFRFAERWRDRVAADTEWLVVHDHTTGGEARVHADFAREAQAIDARGDGWPDVHVPTLILHGIHDDVVPIERSRELAARTGARLVELDDGHDLLRTLPRVLDEIDAFV